MWIFGKKKTAELDLSWLRTDMHSHLVPGIDDGAPDVATSLEMIRGLQEVGFQRFITTPHILWEMYPNTPETINSGLTELQKSIETAGISTTVHAAAEYFLDEHFEEELKNKSPLLTIKDNMVLVEFSMVTARLQLHDVIFDIQMQNYHPIIAHPERYSYLHKKQQAFTELKNMGCLFQLNLLSLTGYYGKTVQALAEDLVKTGIYDFAGTDLHHPRHLSALQKLAGNKSLFQLRDSGRLQNPSL